MLLILSEKMIFITQSKMCVAYPFTASPSFQLMLQNELVKYNKYKSNGVYPNDYKVYEGIINWNKEKQ